MAQITFGVAGRDGRFAAAMSLTQEVKTVLGRLQRRINLKPTDDRNIRLGLERIERVVPQKQTWEGIHVAGTNGKGSICAYISGLLALNGLSHGRYVSPAFPDRHNAVTINGMYANPKVFAREEEHVLAKYENKRHGMLIRMGDDPGPLTPFELDTAIALRLFEKTHVDYGVVEVGMGGDLDATNVMRRKAITVISKIDFDHREYLGNRIEDIAKAKAGIMREGIPCVVDSTNSTVVKEVLLQHAQEVGTNVHFSRKALPLLESINPDGPNANLEEWQKSNLLCAGMAFRLLFPTLSIDFDQLLNTQPQLPGRMARVGIPTSLASDGFKPALVDGAHNMLGLQALSNHVDHRLRNKEGPVTWVMAMSRSASKPFRDMLAAVIKPQDNLAFIEYQPRQNEPAAVPAELARPYAETLVHTKEQIYDGESTLEDALQWACQIAGDKPLVIAGSLYFVRDLYSLPNIQRPTDLETRRPGRAQSERLSKAARGEQLAPREQRGFEEGEEASRMDTAAETTEATQERDSRSSIASTAGPRDARASKSGPAKTSSPFRVDPEDPTAWERERDLEIKRQERKKDQEMRERFSARI